MAVRFWEVEWHGIRFEDLGPLSSTRLPDSAFYDAFYREFFRRVRHFDDLDDEWRRKKDRVARFIADRLVQGDVLLSIGCGLGYVEHRLRALAGGAVELYAHEVAPEALRWLAAELPARYIRTGSLPEALPEGVAFDLIYLSAIDYTMSDREIVAMLRTLKPFLKRSGQLLLVSASFNQRGWRTPFRAARRIMRAVRERMGFGSRGQLWGWLRSRREYWRLLEDAGFARHADGFVDGKGLYWISGRLPATEGGIKLGTQ